jgi:hypothetical protein
MKLCVEEPVQTLTSAGNRTSRPQPNCVLSVGEQQLPAAITEERGGTMHVIVQGSPQFWVEDDGTLKTPDADFAVRVFNIVREAADGDDVAGTIPAFRVGLERLGPIERKIDPEEADQPEVEAVKTNLAPVREEKTRISPFSILALVMVAAVLVGAVIVWKTSVGKWTFPFKLPGISGFAAGQVDSQGNGETPDSVSNPTPLRIASDISELPGGAPFVQAEVIDKLSLTPTQTGDFERLNKLTLEALNDLEKYSGSDDRWELAQKRTVLLNEARQQALQLLTEPQRKLWDELTK